MNWHERQYEQFTDDDQTAIVGTPAYFGTGSRKVPLTVREWFARLLRRDKRVRLVDDDHWENAYGEDLSGRHWNGVYFHGGQAARDLRP